MKNKLTNSTESLEPRVMLAASAVPFQNLDTNNLETVDDLPDSITISAENSESLLNLSETSRASGDRPILVFDENGDEIPDPRPDIAGLIRGAEAAEGIFFGARASTLREPGRLSRAIQGSANEFFDDGQIALNNTLGSSAAGLSTGEFVQEDGETFFFVGTQEGRVTADENESFSFENDTPEFVFSAVLPAIEAEIENARAETSEGGATVTEAERQQATINGLVAGAEFLSSAVFRGVTGGQDDGSTLLERVTLEEDSDTLETVVQTDAESSSEVVEDGGRPRRERTGTRRSRN